MKEDGSKLKGSSLAGPTVRLPLPLALAPALTLPSCSGRLYMGHNQPATAARSAAERLTALKLLATQARQNSPHSSRSRPGGGGGR